MVAAVAACRRHDAPILPRGCGTGLKGQTCNTKEALGLCLACKGDVGYVPFAMGHYVENTSDETPRFLEVFKSDCFADMSLSQWLALTPPAPVRAHLHLNEAVMGALRNQNEPVVNPSLLVSAARARGEKADSFSGAAAPERLSPSRSLENASG